MDMYGNLVVFEAIISHHLSIIEAMKITFFEERLSDLSKGKIIIFLRCYL